MNALDDVWRTETTIGHNMKDEGSLIFQDDGKEILAINYHQINIWIGGSGLVPCLKFQTFNSRPILPMNRRVLDAYDGIVQVPLNYIGYVGYGQIAGGNEAWFLLLKRAD